MVTSLTVALLLVVFGATAAYATTPVVSVTSASVGRDASTGQFTYDVSATADAVQGSGGVCSSSSFACTFYLYGQHVDGTTILLQSATIAWGATFPYAHEFIGTVDSSKVIAVQAQVTGDAGTVYSNWTPVTDPFAAPAVSMSVLSIGRDATGKFTYDLTATANTVQGSGRVCPSSSYSCNLLLYVQLVDGTATLLQSVPIPWGASFPYAHEFTGTVDSTQVIAVQAAVAGYGATIYSNWTPVTDPFASPVVSMSVLSIGRDASTGNLTYDVSATANAVQGSGRVCFSSSYSCYFYLYGQRADGTTILLQSATIAWGASFPYAHEFTGNIASTKVIAVRAEVDGYGAAVYGNWTPVTDPLTTAAVAGSMSVSVISVGRDASTGNLTYDVSASVSGASLTNGPCGGQSYNCTLHVQTQSSAGDITELASTGLPAQASFTNEFVGSVSRTKIVAIRAYTTSYYAPASLYTPWVAVTDPYPDRSVTVTSASVGRDASTGNLTYDVSASVFGASLTDGPCGGQSYTCILRVQAQSAAGDITELANTSLPTQASFFTNRFVGTISRTKIVAIRAYTTSHYALTSLYTPWLTVTDPYPARSVTLNAVSIGRDASTGNLAYDVSATVLGAALPDGPCSGQSYTCTLRVQTQSAAGDITELANVALPLQDSFTNEFVGSSSRSKIVAIRAYTTSYYAPASLYTPWVLVHDRDKSESVGGGNGAEKGCQCSNGDPVNTQTGEFYETGSDLGVPGVGPAVAVGRTYSSVSAAVNGPFGYGTTSNFNSSLVVDTVGNSSDPLPRQVHIVQENGATVPFSEAINGTYPAASWELATLAHDATSGNWTFTRDKKQVFVFNSSGALVSTSDLHGNTVTYGYTSGQVTSITGSGGREVDLTWSSGRVSAIKDLAGRTVTYTYDSSGNLTAVNAADNAIWQYSYDSSHRMLTETTPAGGVTTNVYNSTGQVTSQTDPVGRVTTFSYSGATTTVTLPGGSVTTYTFNQGQPAAITTATGTALAATTKYSYDANGNRVSQTDPLGNTTSYTYDAAGNALTTTDPLGKVTTRTYDSLRDVTSVTDPLGRATAMAYNSVGDLTSLTTPAGNVSTSTWNSNGTLASSTDARGKTSAYTYDSAGRPQCLTDPDSRQTCQSYDSRGFATSKTDPAGKVTTLTYDNAGRVLTVMDPNSHTTTYAYDGDGNLTSTKDASNHTATAAYDRADQRTSSTDGRGKTTSYTDTARGSVATVTDPNGHATTNAYDALNRLTSTTDALSRVTSFGYDLDGRKISTTLPSGAVSSSSYDAAGRVTATTDARGKVTQYVYDAAGQVTSVTDPLSRVTSYTYTADGKVSVVTLPGGSTQAYGYDANDVQTSFTNADGNITSYTYDDAGLLSSKTLPGSLTTAYSYDSAGRIHTVTTPDGVVATRSYDDGGRLTGISYPNSADNVTYTYNADGTRATMTDRTWRTTYTYNADANLTYVQNGNAQTVGYAYDAASQLTSITYPGSHTVTYGYNNAGNMTSVTDWASRTTTLTVTPDGLQSTRSDPSGVTETRSYNANDQLTDISSATSSATLSDYGYGYDNAGQLTSSTTTDALHTTATTNNWGYTALGQLSSTAPSTGYTTSPAGKVTATPAGDAFSYNSKQQLASASNTGYGTSSTYGYDSNGSRTSTTTTYSSAPTVTLGYSYDARGNLVSVVNNGTTSVAYSSDGNGLRQTRYRGSTTQHFLWDINHSIPLLLDDGTHSYIYATGTTPIAQIDDTAGTIEYLHSDNVGSVRTITNTTGTVVGTTDYTPYGALDTHSGTSNSSFGYATAWTDPATGTDYLRAREYDPATAQFLQVDPAVDQTQQPYEYVADDPLGVTDPTGLCGYNPFGCDPTNQAIETAQHQMWGNVGDFLRGLGAGITGESSSPLPCFGPDNGAFTAGNNASAGVFLFITFGMTQGGDSIAPGGRAASNAGVAASEGQAGVQAAEGAVSSGLRVGEKIAGQMAPRGWSESLMRETVDNPATTHSVWDFTSGTRQAATAYARSDGSYVVVNDETGVVVQVSDINRAGWKPVWEDSRFQR